LDFQDRQTRHLLDLDVASTFDRSQNGGDLTRRAQNSSPKILIARFSLTPAISSLKRIWIGCEKPILLPGNFDASSSSCLIKSSFDRPGSGHWSRGFKMM